MTEKYKEPLISRLIFIFRKVYFKWLKIKNRIKKMALSKRKDPVKVTEVKTSGNTVKAYCERKLAPIDITDPAEGGNERLAVYTCIYGGYDMICEPLYKSKMCDYYIITDGDVPQNSVWKKIEPLKPEGFDSWDPSIRNRYYKMHPEVAFPEYKYSMYVDGNVKLLTDMYPYVSMMKNKVIGIHNYPIYDCFYRNAEFLKELGLVDKEICDRQVEAYRKEGFPEHFGYFECTIILRRHNNKVCKALMNMWWEQYNTWVKRDQQAFVYSLWKNGMDKTDVACLGPNLRKSPRFKIRSHNREHYLVR